MKNLFEISSTMGFLVVDESESYRNLIRAGLGKLGFKNIRITSNTLHALQVLKSVPIDLVICERNMPILDGSHVLKEVRESFEIQGTPFLMIGAESQVTKEDVALLAEYEVDGYLTKPFTFKVLIEKITQCIEHYKNPNNIEFNIAKAKLALGKKDIEVAIKMFTTLLEIIPNSARIRVCLARCHREINEFEPALAYCRQAIKCNPLYVQNYDEMGNIFLASGKTEEALIQYKNALKLSPNNPVRYNQIIDILIKNERFKDAESIMKLAHGTSMDFDELNFQYGKVLYFLGKVNKAVIYFEKALAKDPDNKIILNMMGICLKDLGKLEDALKHYNHALKNYPLDIKIMVNKGLCLIKLSRLEQAKKLFAQILTIDPTHKKALRNLEDIEKKLNPLADTEEKED